MRILQDLGIRAVLSLILVLSLVVMIFTGKNVPESFAALVTMAVAFYFNRPTDKSL